ncbi:hypothetical protein AB9K35_17585 [Leisingera sp. XS_AS12]
MEASMIISLIRLIIFATIGMSIAYLMARYYISSTLREELEREWQELPIAVRGPSCDLWVGMRMARSANSIRLRAFLIAFAVPTLSGLAIILTINFL